MTSSGSYLVFLTILMPVLIGVAALGAEGTYVLTQHRALQAAADSAAVSVASYYASQKTAVNTPTAAQLSNQAKAVAATYGFVNGTNGACVTVNNPPTSGNFTNTATDLTRSRRSYPSRTRRSCPDIGLRVR